MADVKAMAKSYNRAHPEAAAEIDAGRPVFSATITTADKQGRLYRLVMVRAVQAPDGGLIYAEEPHARTFAPRDQRTGARGSSVVTAQRIAEQEAKAAGLPLVFKDRR